MARDRTLEFVIGGLVVGGTLMINGFRRFRVRRKIEDLPTSRISTAAQGLVEFQGTALPYGARASSAADGAKVLFSRVKVEYYRSGKNGGWKTRWTYDSGERFLLQDETGVAHVIVKGAELFLKSETTQWDAMTPEARRVFLQAAGSNISSPGSLDSGSWRIVEQKITEGEKVLAIGVFKTRRNEPEVVLKDPLSGAETRQRSSGGLMKDQVHPLVLADGTQEEVLSRVNHGVLMMIFGAVLISGAVFVGLSRYFG